MNFLTKLQGHRWFIWTIVFIVVSLGGLATHIIYITNQDSNEVSGVMANSRLFSKNFAKDPWQPFLNKNWNVIASATSDFNNDGVLDVALVAEDTAHPIGQYERRSIYPRRLLILLGTRDIGYKLSVSSDNAIMLDGDGGAGVGDPFNGLNFENNKLHISFFGGDSDKWYEDYYYVYVNNQWQLADYIQGQYSSIDPGSSNNCSTDYNLEEGQVTETCGSPEHVVSKIKKTFIKPLLLQDIDMSQYGFVPTAK